MVKTIIKLSALIVITAFFAAGCDDGNDNGNGGNGNTADAVTGVAVIPNAVILYRGDELNFLTTVSGTGDYSKAVTWSILEEDKPKHPDTDISPGGLLKISMDETLTRLRIRATSVDDKSKFGTAIVTVPAPVVTGVTVGLEEAFTAPFPIVDPWLGKIDMKAGWTETFTARIEGTNFPEQDVTWSIEEQGLLAEGTRIEEIDPIEINERFYLCAKLTVGAGEPNGRTFTVRAASTEDDSKFTRVIVTVADPQVNSVKIIYDGKDTRDTKLRTNSSYQFAAVVTGTGRVEQDVTWEVDSNPRDMNQPGIVEGDDEWQPLEPSVIDANGELFLSGTEDEGLQIVVRARSTVDPAKAATLRITPQWDTVEPLIRQPVIEE